MKSPCRWGTSWRWRTSCPQSKVTINWQIVAWNRTRDLFLEPIELMVRIRVPRGCWGDGQAVLVIWWDLASQGSSAITLSPSSAHPSPDKALWQTGTDDRSLGLKASSSLPLCWPGSFVLDSFSSPLFYDTALIIVMCTGNIIHCHSSLKCFSPPCLSCIFAVIFRPTQRLSRLWHRL